MSQTTPKQFQTDAIDSGLLIFSECKRLLDAASDKSSRNAAISQHGTLLLEAPTGAGKTLIAGHIVEKLSSEESIVWFWFAPFKGIIGQTASSLRAELSGLRLRELAEDRQVVDSKSGDVFVTTWQAVATKVKDKRNVHIAGESNPTVEELIVALRQSKIRIGVVVDEAHHGFFGSGSETQSMKFFREVLTPEYTILVTATPDDDDIKKFKQHLAIDKINRITISRREPVEEGLIKKGIKCAAYFAPPDQESLVDFEELALKDGIATHKKLFDEIKKLKIDLVPLMLVQVDSSDKSVERTKDKLKEFGFTDAQIAVHTADEPDSKLLALANDETRQVLIFKMAVALGFDAPRAATLVSMRAAKDEDFGVQLVGRILRVHRRLQSKARSKTLPELLCHGYVFLADAEGQEGLDLAGQRINRLQTEYAKVSPTTAIVNFGGQPHVQVIGEDGQISLLPVNRDTHGKGFARQPDVEQEPPQAFMLELMLGKPEQPEVHISNNDSSRGAAKVLPIAGAYSYPLKDGIPKRFQTQLVSAENEVTEDDCAQKFMVSSAEILRALVAKVKVERRTLEVFTHQIEMDFANAHMAPDQAARIAFKVLTKNESFDPRELRRALIKKLQLTLQELAMDEANNLEQVSHMLNVILCARPELLFDAQRTALASHWKVKPTDEALPTAISYDAPLPTSRFNAYGVMPPELNNWERPFAELIDRDSQKIVKWWHRNLPHKPWSVQVVLDNGKGFFPDFIIGIDGRKNEDSALLADPKFAFEISQEQPKTHASHPIYGRVLILSLQGNYQWMTVRFDAQRQKAVLDKEFHLADAAGY